MRVLTYYFLALKILVFGCQTGFAQVRFNLREAEQAPVYFDDAESILSLGDLRLTPPVLIELDPTGRPKAVHIATGQGSQPVLSQLLNLNPGQPYALFHECGGVAALTLKFAAKSDQTIKPVPALFWAERGQAPILIPQFTDQTLSQLPPLSVDRLHVAAEARLIQALDQMGAIPYPGEPQNGGGFPWPAADRNWQGCGPRHSTHPNPFQPFIRA